MVKRFFNSPLFVGLLALGAVGVIYFNVVQPMIGGGISKRVADTLAPFTAAVNEVGAPLVAMNPFDRAKVGWVENPGRDPFFPRPVASTEEKGSPDDLPRAADVYTLSGTMVDPGGRLASVNGRIVREGTRLGDYRVDRIEPGVVWLTGPRGDESITVATDRNNNR